jgi:hypothetical protein
MVRKIAIAGFTATMVLALAARAQEVIPELEGGPGSHPPPQASSKQTLTAKQAKAAADKLKAQQAKLAQQAIAQDAEQARLTKQAADLKAQQAKLDARAAQLAMEEKRLAQLRAEQETANTASLAEITRQKKAVDQQTTALHAEPKTKSSAPPIALQSKPDLQAADANAGAPIDLTKPARLPSRAAMPDAIEKADAAGREAAPDRATAPEEPAAKVPDRPAFAGKDESNEASASPRALPARLDLEAARRSCVHAGENAALARRYYSARYDDAVRVYQDRGWKLRGRMRLESRRGDLSIDTICEVDADGQAQRFVFLRASAERD